MELREYLKLRWIEKRQEKRTIHFPMSRPRRSSKNRRSGIINIHDVAEKLHQKGSDPARQVIYLRADETVPFGVFASLMDAVKQAGITNVSIVTQPLEKNGSRH